MNGDKTYTGFGIPDPAPCPSWCAGNHVGSDIGPARAVIFHGGSAIGGAVLAGGEDVVVFLQAGVQYIAIEATERNMAGMAAIARLISPEVKDRARQLARLMEETRDARQTGPAFVR